MKMVMIRVHEHFFISKCQVQGKGTAWLFHRTVTALLDGTNVRLNWNIESDMNVYWI
jgi:hypothetical protein